MRAGIDQFIDEPSAPMSETERRALLLTGGAATKVRGALQFAGRAGNLFESKEEPQEGDSIRAKTLKDSLLAPFRRLQGQTEEPWQIEIDRARAIHQTVDGAMKKFGAPGAFAAQFGIMGYELAVNIAMLKTITGASPWASSGSVNTASKGFMKAWAARAAKEAPEVAKMFMWTYTTTPGTHEERMRAAKVTAMYRATPMVSMGMPSNFTAMAADTALNQIISLNVNPVYAELRDNAKEAAKERGIDWDKANNVQRAKILREIMTWQQATDVAFDVFTNVLFAQSTKSATKAEIQSFVNEYGKTAEAYAKYLQSRGVNVDATHLTARGMEQAAWLPEMQKEIIGAQGALPASPRPAAPQDGAFSETGLRQVRDRTAAQADLDSSRRAAEVALAGPRSETPVSPDARAAMAGAVARGEALAVPRVNPILEPEKVQQSAQINTALADQLDGVKVETEAARTEKERAVEPQAVSPDVATREGTSRLDESKHPTVELPIESLKLSADVPNFKEGASETGEVEPLQGRYERLGTPPVVVWERTNGDREIITGRHRWNLAKRSGEKTIPAQVVREADGFTKDDAAIFDAEANIRDGQGSVKDYANFFKKRGISREEASSSGLLSREKGRDGYEIGTSASDDLYALFAAGKISPRKAAAIAKQAPGQPEAQKLGMDYAEKHNVEQTEQYMRAVVSMAPKSSDKQLDLLGWDDSWQIQADKMGRAASDIRGELSAERTSLKHALSLTGKRQAEVVKKYGFKTGDKDAIKDRVGELERELISWENWNLDAELTATVRERAGLPPVEKPAASDSFKLESASKAELDAEAKRLADKAKLDDMAIAPLEGRPDADIGQLRLPGTGGEIDLFNAPKQTAEAAPRTAADLAKPVAAHAKGAVVEAMRGLAELVKADPSKLGSGPVMFDEKNYAKAKVHFQKAWVEAKAAGNSVKEFSDYVVAQLGDAIRPFLARFVEEVERSEEWGDKVADARQVDPNTGLRVTAPMKAVGDQEREGFGVKPREPVFTREWDDAVISEARAQISSADKIIAESRKGQRAVTDTDIATMLIAKTERINARVEAANAMKANPDDPAAQKAFTQAQERLTEVYEAIEKAGTTSGRALAAMKMTMDERYGVVENMEWELRAAKGGKEVTPAERTNLERIQQQYVREKAQYEKQVALAKEQYADLEERLGTLEAQIFYDRDIPRLDPATLEKMAEGGRLYSLGLDPDRVTSIAKWMLGKMAKGIKNPNELALKHLGEEARPTINAARAEAAEMAAKAGKGASKQRTGKTKGQPTPASEIRDLYRAQIEAGVREVNEATRNVTAEWNKTHGADAQMTEKQIRDTFSDYGKVIPLTKDEVKRALSELRREAQLTSSIERAMNDLHPLKTGRQRFPPTSEARQMLKTLNNLLKEKGLNAVDPERQLKSAMDARKSRMRDAIEDKKRAIETLQRLAPNKKPPELDAEGQRLKAELDRITEEYNKVFPKEKTSLTDQERLKIATRAAERSLRDVVKELKDARNGIFAMKKRYPNLPNDEYLAGLRAKKRIAQQEVRELRELANPGMKALQDRIKRIQGAIRLYDNKLTTGDFSPRRVNEVDISQNPLAMLEQARLNYLKAEFNKRKEEARFSALPPAEQRIERFQEQAKTWFNYFRNIKSSYDFSGIGRQGGLMMLSDPVQWAKSIPNSLRVYKSEKAGMEYWEGFKKRSNYELYAKAKLGISPGDGRGNFGPADDIFRPDIAAKVPLVKRHMRSFAVILNEMRANLFDKLLANSENPRDVSDEKIRRIANLVNTWTGRGQLPKGWDAETLGYIFWAPRFVSASFDVATMPVRMAVGSVFARGNPYRDEVRKMAAMQYVKAIGSLVALYSASYAMSFLDEENEFYLETNPTSADFGSIQVPFSTQKVNPLTWVRPTATFLARMISGEMLTAEKQKQQLAPWPWVSQEAKEAGYGMRGGIKETLYDFAQTKQNPAYNALLQILTGKDFYGNDMNRAWAAFTGIAPLVPTSAPNLLKSETGIWTDAKEKRLEKLPVFAALYVLAMIGSQPRASDYKSPRQLKINLTKENYAKRVRLAVLRGTSYKVVKGVINSTAAPEARAYLEQFLEEDGADALRAALKAEFSERRKAQKDRAGRMRTDDAESKRRLQLNRLIRAYEKEQKKQEEDKRRRGLERAAQKGQIA